MMGRALHRIGIMQEGVRRKVARWMVAIAEWSVSEHKMYLLLVAVADKISPDSPEEHVAPYQIHSGYDRR